MNEEKQAQIDGINCKNYADLIQEECMKRGENKHKRFVKMTEEQRNEIEEKRRIKYANLTEKERKKMAEYKHKRQANRSAEKRRKVAEYFRKLHGNKSEEKQNRETAHESRRNSDMTGNELKNKQTKKDICNRKKYTDLTEKERIKRVEIKRKKYANLSKEEQNKLAKRRRKKYANMTEEERKKVADYKRERYTNMTAEKRRKLTEHFRKWHANMTKEKQVKVSEYNRKYYSDKIEQLNVQEYCYKQMNSMNEEVRLKKLEYRKLCADMTKEVRKRKVEYYRNKHAEEERRKKKEERLTKLIEMQNKRVEYYRKRHAKMTEKEQKKLSEYYRKWRANRNEVKTKENKIYISTQEKQKKDLEYYYKRKAKIEKKRIKKKLLKLRANTPENTLKRKAEHDHKQNSNITKKARIERLENLNISADTTQEKWLQLQEYYSTWCSNVTKRKEIEQILKPHTDTTENVQTENNDRQGADIIAFRRLNEQKKMLTSAGCNLLKILIYQMIDSNASIEIISPCSLQNILVFVGINRPPKRDVPTYKSAVDNLRYEMDVCFLLKLLKTWKNWLNPDDIKRYPYDAFFLYLKRNILNFKSYQKALLQKELSNLFSSENFISVSCSLKQLQALFYHSPQNYGRYYSDNIFIISRQLMELLPEHIIILPYVSTRIVLPNFSMTHQNNHYDEFILLNMTNKKLNVNENKRFFSNKMMRKKYSEKYLKNNIVKFLNQLKNILTSEESCDITIEKKAELTIALMIFENDLVQCDSSTIRSICKYNTKLTHYPYSRYLGYSDESNICISTSDQKAMNNSELNNRLQQIRYPQTTFILENFNIPCKIKTTEPHYKFDERFLREINTCISYSCLLCNEDLGSSSPSEIITDHFTKYHGLIEPYWECTKCFKSFTNNYLLYNHWKHDCK